MKETHDKDTAETLIRGDGCVFRDTQWWWTTWELICLSSVPSGQITDVAVYLNKWRWGYISRQKLHWIKFVKELEFCDPNRRFSLRFWVWTKYDPCWSDLICVLVRHLTWVSAVVASPFAWKWCNKRPTEAPPPAVYSQWRGLWHKWTEAFSDPGDSRFYKMRVVSYLTSVMSFCPTGNPSPVDPILVMAAATMCRWVLWRHTVGGGHQLKGFLGDDVNKRPNCSAVAKQFVLRARRDEKNWPKRSSDPKPGSHDSLPIGHPESLSWRAVSSINTHFYFSVALKLKGWIVISIIGFESCFVELVP